ncbi:NACHT domain-containing protein [Actinomadura madurae]|uniref:NACHT domain-containing protein n=1 Tax=Actinomadura madurae TaxID=1993 RepID=UPI000D843780|nr:NACHT domain-containing protein [Actinomadura madurae]SPT50066.1 Predicted NTPase (NACHT family) [Actinomadura madurae]
MLKVGGRTLIAASLTVAAGVAVNQILNNGKLSWSWGYLALVFTVLGALTQAPQQTETASTPAQARRTRRGSRREYLRRMRSAVDQMETIGLVTQAEYVLRTRQVYVDVMLQPRPVTDAVTDAGIGHVPPTVLGRREPLASFLAPGRVLAVLGAAGSGKTTLARYTALEMAERRWSRGPLPVLLFLRDHVQDLQAEEPAGLPEIVAAAPWLGGAVSAEWLEKRLERGRCVVLLDGLDEVADAQSRGRVVQWVENQISRYPGNAFVVTSRPFGYDGNRLSRADVLQVQRFTSRQIRAFLDAWYRAIERRSREGDPEEIDRIAAQAADDLFRRIIERPALYDLAANPLLLTMIANVHRYRSSLPGSRAALYEEVCQVLLHRRQEAKNLADTALDGLSGDKKERIVQELAWYMMRRRLRDVPAEEAERAIRTVLQRTAPDIAPDAFLHYARRSGLLLEHRHRRYGFAHLTLQEYLAAALVPGHASRRQVLVDNVSDPWWRETTLLWAARADAGPVVEASLAARTVPALNLAFACADEARELDPALRDQLDRLLTTEPGDPDEVRLLDGVAAVRALQDTHALDDTGTRICAHPVDAALWNRFASRIDRPLAPPGALTGYLWTRDLKDFVDWLNGLFGDGTSYRLPTPPEALHALGSDLYPGTETILYAADHDRTGEQDQMRLVTADPAEHPHHPTAQQVENYPDVILDHTHMFFRLLRHRSSLTFPQLAAFAAPRDLARPEHRLLHLLDVALDLSFDREGTRELTRDRALDLTDGLRPNLDHLLRHPSDRRPREPYGERDLDRDLDRASVTVFHQARRVCRGLEFELDLGLDFDFAPRNIGILSRALSELLNRETRVGDPNVGGDLRFIGDVSRDIDITLDQALSRGMRRALDLALIHAPDSEAAHARRPITTLIGALARVPPRDVPDLADKLSLAIDLAYAYRDQTLERLLSRVRDLALARVRTLRSSSISAHALAHDLAFARIAADSDLWTVRPEAVTGIGRACSHLMRYWASQIFVEHDGSNQPRRTTGRNWLSDVLQDQLGTPYYWSPAEDPVLALADAERLAETNGEREMAALIKNAMALVAPLSDRSPVKQSHLVLSATSILAALTLSENSRPELSRLLHGALCALIALTPDVDIEASARQLSPRALVLVPN